jgi:hypothetical protein
MAEPTAQRLRVTFTATRADTGRFVIACEPSAGESAPVIPGGFVNLLPINMGF